MNPNPNQPRGGEQDRLILGLELVLTTVSFAGLGWLLDRWLGTFPVLTVFLGAFTLTYLVWKMVKGYDTEMAQQLRERRPLRRGPIDG